MHLVFFIIFSGKKISVFVMFHIFVVVVVGGVYTMLNLNSSLLF